jgi:uncharacterized protein YndB with AHSA1/START domain
VTDDLRYADCPTTDATVDVAAPPETVWPLVSDIQLPARFSGEFLGAEWLDGASGPQVGARFVGRNQHTAIGSWETTSTVTACDPPHTFEWTVGDLAAPSATWRFTLEPSAGGTRVTQWMRMGPGRSGINAAIEAMPDKESRILQRRLAELQANMQATLDGVKQLAETGDSATSATPA